MVLQVSGRIGVARAGRGAFMALAAVVLAGCVQSTAIPGPYGEKKPFAPTKQEQYELTQAGHANAIAKICPAEFQINRPARDAILKPLVKRAADSGLRRVSSEDLLGMSAEQARAIGLAYEKERGIVRSDRETWCAAGRYEVARKSPVGKYLIKVGS
jgi:hypothetical protein